MFYGEGSDKPLFYLRKMILSNTIQERRAALDELYPFVKESIKETLEAMEGLPVTIRLLDPPLHEFVPQGAEKQAQLAQSLGITTEEIRKRGEELHETNPMMGHRGVRLGITYPEITEMQTRAIFEAAIELIAAGKKCLPEIMVPVTCDVAEIDKTKEITQRIYKETLKKFKLRKLDYKYGTMIEIPRAALLSDRIAKSSEFFSFGTNDLTQMTFGFSRDDIGAFMHDYIEQKILPADPFQTIDQDGVGELIKLSVKRGRKTRKNLKVGICGEHGGDPASVEFCYKTGLTYVSCSPFRVPIARLAAAQAAIKAGGVQKKQDHP
jgi:pyruvate,orthophosphate dikinase